MPTEDTTQSFLKQCVIIINMGGQLEPAEMLARGTLLQLG